MRVDTSLAILATVGGAAAFWRMECRGRLGVARIDPLMRPNEVSEHAHSIHGSSGFGLSSTYEDLRNGDCTSCEVIQDKSAYWTPSLYFKHANGSYELVPQDGGLLAYYFLNADARNPNGGIKAFPNGFRMIAGDSTRRNYSIAGLSVYEPDPEKSIWAALGQTTQHDLAQRAIGFNCLHYHMNPNEPSLYRHYLPEKAFLDANCKSGLRFEVMFPSCWNGKDITSANYKSHVAYPDLVINGGCPDGFNVKLPGLFYETIWRTDAFANVQGQFVISNGDVQGLGYHGDFISGWDSNFLQAAVNQCTNLSGQLVDCPIFTLQNLDKMNQCKLKAPPAIAKEKVLGIIGDSLPGGVVIQYGPGPATYNKPSPQSAYVPLPSASHSAGGPASASSSKPGHSAGATASASSSQPDLNAFNVGASTSSPSPTPIPTPTPSDPPIPAGYEAIRTDYITNGNMVTKVIVIETIECVIVATETVTVTATFGDKARRELLHLHRHRHGH